MHQTKQACQLCQEHAWQPIDTLCSGIWNKTQTELVRQVMLFPIGLCQHCGHTQVMTEYTAEILSNLYFSHDRQPDIWGDSANAQSPYQDMLDFIGADIISTTSTVADFGCGEAQTLKLLAQQQPHTLYYGFDFNINACRAPIKGVQCDLNQLAQLSTNDYGAGFNLITSSHVLEHVKQPLQFLQQLHRFLRTKGWLFIEVPDCGQPALNCTLENTNLVHAQHIHYFTADSLRQVIQQAGFDVIKLAQLRSGEIPRLLLLAQKTTVEPQPLQISHTAAAAVLHRSQRYMQQLDRLAVALDNILNTAGKAGLWGVGGDFYNLLQRHPALAAAIKRQQLALYDYELAGHHYLGQHIQSSKVIAESGIPVFIVPLYTPTRQRMQAISKDWSNVIGDSQDTA